MRSASASFLGIFIGMLVNVARSSRVDDMMLADQVSMIQLPGITKEMEKGAKEWLAAEVKNTLEFPGRLRTLQGDFTTKCASLDWATEADCSKGKMLVDLLQEQNGGKNGNSLAMARQVGTLWILAYGSPGAAMRDFDTDGSGEITFEDMGAPLETWGLKGGNAAVKKVWDILDADHDDVFSQQEIYDYARSVLVIRQFLPEIDSVDPSSTSKSSADLLPAIDANILHLPESSPENLKVHDQFVTLAANLTNACPALGWTTEEDCAAAKSLLGLLISIPTFNSVDTLAMAQGLAALELFIHIPDTYSFRMLDGADQDGSFHVMEYLAASAPLTATLGMSELMKAFALLDRDGSGNVTREDVYQYVRGGLVVRHYVLELDRVSHGLNHDGSSSLTDEDALKMSLHIIHPPPVPKQSIPKWPKLACILAIMLGAFFFQWFCCMMRIKKEDEMEKKDESASDSASMANLRKKANKPIPP